MPSSYELWLLDDGGKRLLLLDDFAYFSYSRSTSGFGTLQIALPYQTFRARINPVFQPDRRIDVWRSPGLGYPMRREQTFLIRMYKTYTREDGVQLIEFYCRDPKDLLNRRFIIQAAGTPYTRKTDYADDLMKEIVREQMLYAHALDPNGTVDPDRAFPTGEFLVQGDLSLGPSLSGNFSDRNVLDTLKEISEATAQQALDTLGVEKIYFDVVPIELRGLIEEILDEADPTNPILDEMGMALLDELSLVTSQELGFRFETYAGLYGIDRTAGLVFSVENNNLKFPYYSKSHMEEINVVVIKGFGRGDSREWDEVLDQERIDASRWNRYEVFQDGSTEPDQTKLADAAQHTLYKGRPNDELSAIFLNVENGPDSPRSLYGIDWDLGDLLPVEYGDKRFDVEVDIVYVALSENGKEVITGRNTMNESDAS